MVRSGSKASEIQGTKEDNISYQTAHATPQPPTEDTVQPEEQGYKPSQQELRLDAGLSQQGRLTRQLAAAHPFVDTACFGINTAVHTFATTTFRTQKKKKHKIFKGIVIQSILHPSHRIFPSNHIRKGVSSLITIIATPISKANPRHLSQELL